MRQVLPLLLTLSLTATLSGSGGAAEWAEGVPYTTDWDDAIQQVQDTGRILFIYSGYQQPGT